MSIAASRQMKFDLSAGSPLGAFHSFPRTVFLERSGFFFVFDHGTNRLVKLGKILSLLYYYYYSCMPEKLLND